MTADLLRSNFVGETLGLPTFQERHTEHMFYAINTARRYPVDDHEVSDALALPTFIVEAENETMARTLAVHIADTFEPIQVAPIMPAFVVGTLDSEFVPRFRTELPAGPFDLAPEPATGPDTVEVIEAGHVVEVPRCKATTPVASRPEGLARCTSTVDHHPDMHSAPSQLAPGGVVRWPVQIVSPV